MSRLAHGALADGVNSVDLHAKDGLYSISCDKPWLVMEAFEELIAYPALAANSSRRENSGFGFRRLVYGGGRIRGEFDGTAGGRVLRRNRLEAQVPQGLVFSLGPTVAPALARQGRAGP